MSRLPAAGTPGATRPLAAPTEYTRRVDILVIGAGVVGCAVGYELAARGARVRIFDMRDIGQGASRASAGVLCPHIEGHAAALLQLGVRSLALYDAFVARVASDAHIPVEYQRTGTLEVALTDEDAARLRTVASRHAAAGLEHQYLDGRAARALEPALSAQTAGALLVPSHGYVAVPALNAALAAAAQVRGATLERARPVQRIARGGSRTVVTTSDGDVEADAVVIAAGSWSGAIEGQPAAVPVKPIRGQLLHLEFEAAPVSRVIWGADCYLVPWRDGSLLVGATSEDVGFDERATVAGVHDLLDSACELLPPTWAAQFAGVRVGLRPATPDGLPVIGPSSSQPGLFYATGHFRNGVLLAPLTAQLLADLVLEGRTAPELGVTTPERFGL